MADFFLQIAPLVAILLALFVDAIQTLTIRRINKRLDREAEAFESRGSIGEQFGEWLLDEVEVDGPDGPDGPKVKTTNVALLAGLVGHKIAQSFSMSAKGIVSGDARRMRAIENGITVVEEANLSPNQKAAIALAKRVGEAVGFDVSPSEVALIAQKIGINLKNDGHEGSGQTW